MAANNSSPNPLEINGLEAWYPTGDEPALINANIQLRPGEVAAIVGPSGVGKSTLLNAVLNEISVVSGNIKIAGEVVLNGRAINPHLYSFVPQDTNLVETLTVWETIELAAYVRLGGEMDEKDRWQRVTEVLNQLDLYEKRNDEVGKLSGGQKRRVSIAMELVSEPQLLILDEPTTGLDEHLIREVHDLFRSIADGPRKPAILFVTHSVTQLDQVDKIIAMGKAAESHPKTATVRYFGSPDNILDAFNATAFPDLLNALSEPPADGVIVPSGRKPKSFNRPYKTLSWRRSFLYNLKRQWLLLGGLKGLIKMFLATLAVGAIIAATLLLISSLGLGLNIGGINEDFLTYTSILVILLALVGTILPVMGIVGFWQTGRREQKWGVSARTMVWAQMCIQMLIIVPMVAAATAFSLWWTELPSTETILPQLGNYSAHWQLFSLLMVSTLASYCIGVLIGCLNTSTNNAIIAAGVVIAIMLVGNGLIFSWSEKPPLYYLSFLVPSRTGMALVASNFNAEQAMGITNDRAFRMEETEFYTVILGTIALAVVIMLIAMYTARYPLFQAGSGKRESTKDTSQPMPTNPIASGLKNPRFAAAILTMLLLTTGGVYARQYLGDSTPNNGSGSQNLAQAAPTQPVPSVGSKPQDQPSEPAQQSETTQAPQSDKQSGDNVNIDVSVNVDAQLEAKDAGTENNPATTDDDGTAEAEDFAASPELETEDELTGMGGSSEIQSESSGPISGVYFDLGSESEPESIRGLGEPMDVATEGKSWSCEIGGFSDTTKRDQLQPAADGSWVVVPLQGNPAESATVSFCIEEDESGADTWELWLGGDRPNAYGCDQRLMEKPADLTPGLNVISLELPAECIPSGQIMLVFTSQQQDGAGLFGFLVEQESMAVAEAEEAPSVDAELQAASLEEEATDHEANAETSEEPDSADEEITEEPVVDAREDSAEQSGDEAADEPAIQPIDAVVEEAAVEEDAAIANSDEDTSSEESAEEVAIEEPTEEPTEEPAEEPVVEELPVDPMPPGAVYLDIGGDPEPRDISGLSSSKNDFTEEGDAWSCKLGGYRDYTSRDQQQSQGGSEATVRIQVSRLQQTTISFCIESSESGYDDWEVHMGNDDDGYQICEHIYLTTPSHFSPGMNVATLVIPPDCLQEDELELVFVNRGGEGVGIWGILVDQDPSVSADPPTPTPDSTPGY